MESENVHLSRDQRVFNSCGLRFEGLLLIRYTISVKWNKFKKSVVPHSVNNTLY